MVWYAAIIVVAVAERYDSRSFFLRVLSGVVVPWLSKIV